MEWHPGIGDKASRTGGMKLSVLADLIIYMRLRDGASSAPETEVTPYSP